MQLDAIHYHEITLWFPVGTTKEFLEESFENLSKKYRNKGLDMHYGEIFLGYYDVGWLKLKTPKLLIRYEPGSFEDKFEFQDSAFNQINLFAKFVKEYMQLTKCTEYKKDCGR